MKKKTTNKKVAKKPVLEFTTRPSQFKPKVNPNRLAKQKAKKSKKTKK